MTKAALIQLNLNLFSQSMKVREAERDESKNEKG